MTRGSPIRNWQEGQNQRENFEDAVLLAWGREVPGPRSGTASKPWNRQGRWSFPGISRRDAADDTLV